MSSGEMKAPIICNAPGDWAAPRVRNNEPQLLTCSAFRRNKLLKLYTINTHSIHKSMVIMIDPNSSDNVVGLNIPMLAAIDIRITIINALVVDSASKAIF